MEKKTTTDRKILFTSAIIGVLLSFPVTGFIYGFSSCKDCGEGISGIFGRIFIGFVEAILTTITLGAPWDNEGGTTSTNLRFYVFLAALIFTLMIFFIRKRNQNK
ncbi:hypothetical protein L0669_17185 [Flavobacterium bizetiae]|uniref:hypothetical protein n=1 Tax=Flavobacterium bizetiae TaxID=2704140 RepID=UPI0021E80604|nr:hypothetical protein [Flavobacterium bizetiae]UTN03060.1 hypothetical protein L0669_17185 [Flavobacterium bizetiae]